MDVRAVVLAAGKGTRLYSEKAQLPKVMRLACGKPLLHYVLSALDFVPEKDITVVVGFMAEKVREAFPGYGFALQEPQLGTGHAVMAARERLEGFTGTLLVCYGDMPLLKKEVYQRLLKEHLAKGNICTLLAGKSSLPLPYGRIVRDETGGLLRVVEDRDCTPEEKKIDELNVGIYAFQCQALLGALDKLTPNNAQGEYYLTDVPELLRAAGGKTGVYCERLDEQLIGVNTQEQLDEVESYRKARQ